MARKGFNNHSTFAAISKYIGNAGGKIMGNVLTNMNAAFDGFTALAKSNYNNFLKSTPVAIAKQVTKLAAKATQAFARDARELAEEAGLRMKRAPATPSGP